ncbi:MAG: MFS transporter [Patescibacteria group bacterium]
MLTRGKALRPILFTSFLYFAHLSVLMYINSTVLSTYASSEYVSIFYVLAAAGSIVLLFCLPKIVQTIGLVRTTASIFIMLAVLLLLLGTTNTLWFVAIFILYNALSQTFWYCNDLFVAHYSQNENIGKTRGISLTVISTAIAIMPLIAGFLVERNGLQSVYIAAASLLFIGAGVIIRSQRAFADRPYSTPSAIAAWHAIRAVPSLRRVLSINFMLQFFYVWMTLFTPLYLHTVLGFHWSDIGIAFSIMLTAFVLLQYAVGRWADSVGEKKLLIAGFLIGGISTIAFGLWRSNAIMTYAAILFCTRVGICMVEVLAETYFFKQVSDKDEGVVSVYRMMYPLAYIIAPLIGWAIISLFSYMTLFIVLGAFLFAGAIYTTRLADIR